MDNKQNFKKLLCYNIVNNLKCVYKNKCMFAHTLEEQNKEQLRSFIIDMIYKLDNLSNINIYENKILYDELLIYTKECKNCINKKCPGGYNCKFGTCLKENKICYNDLVHGKCYNILNVLIFNDIKNYRCIHGLHLSEKKLIPYNQRIIIDLPNLDYKIIPNYNYKNNIITLNLNDNTIKIVKELINNKLNKNDSKRIIINNENNENYILKNID